MKKVSIILVLGIGLGAVAGVMWFRANRLTAADYAEAAKMQDRVAAIDKKSPDEPAPPDAAKAPDANGTAPDTALAKAPEKAPEKAPDQAKPLPEGTKVLPIESMPEKTPDRFSALFRTTKGDFTVEFTREWAPNGVDRMYDLIKQKFFTDMRAFRVVAGFVVQFGISGDPKVSEKWAKKNILDDSVKMSNSEGLFTFAAGGEPNTRSTQVFINLGDNSVLDSKGFAPIGKVVSGMDVVKSLYSGYGEAITNLQGQIAEIGNSFLDTQFPNLDSIKETLFVESAATPATATAIQAPSSSPSAPETAAAGNGLPSETAPKVFRVKFDCTMGSFTIECTRSWSPIGADRFYTLVKNGFYNDSKFFRVVPGFIAQFGLPADPTKYGAWVVSRIDDDPFTVKNTEGTVVFAKPPKLPNARSTQLFINLKDNSSMLDPQSFTPFGKIIEGLDVVKKINASYGESPLQSKIREQGNAYLNPNFPNLDGVKSATIVEDSPAAPAAATPPPAADAAASAPAPPPAAETPKPAAN